MSKVKNFGQKIIKSGHKNSPTLLLIAGTVLFVSTIIEVARQTPKAIDSIEEAKNTKFEENEDGSVTEVTLTPFETVKAVAPVYWKAALFGSGAIFCFFCGHKIHLKRNAALAAAYGVSEAKRLEYMAKTKELLGEKQEHDIQHKIAEDRVNSFKNKLDSEAVEALKQLPQDKLVVLDAQFGSVFFSNSELISNVKDMLNDKLRLEHFVPLNTMYHALGARPIGAGEELGWNIEDGPINIITYYIKSDNIIYLVMDYDYSMRHSFGELY